MSERQRPEIEADPATSRSHHEHVAVLSSAVKIASDTRQRPLVLPTPTPLWQRIERILESNGMPYFAYADRLLAAAGLGAGDDPVLRALLCALNIIEAVQRDDPGLFVQCGIDYGNVTADSIGPRRLVIAGRPVCAANAAMELARPNKVSVTQAAWDLIASDFRGQRRGHVDVAGVGSVEIIECMGVLEPHQH